jgi:hypothetical protein
MEGSLTLHWFEESQSEPFSWHAVPCMPLALPKSGRLWTGLVLAILLPQRYLVAQNPTPRLIFDHPLIVSVLVGPAVPFGSWFVVCCQLTWPGRPGRPSPLVVLSDRFGSVGPDGWSLLGLTHCVLYLSEVESGLRIIRV